MTTDIKPAPDWFDRFWEEHQDKIPIYLRGQKKAARMAITAILEAMAQQARTPDGVRIIVAFAKISSILKGTRGVLDAPDPTPEQVAEAVQRLAERVRP